MYTYKKLLHELEFLGRWCETGCIGISEDGRPIPYLFVGKKNAPCIFITAGIHAREHISSVTCMRQAEFALRYNNFNGGIYFIPMLNPDGNVIVEKGINGLNWVDVGLITNILGDKTLYKANARGVDLNVNFDAKFGKGAQNVFSVASESFVGPFSFSESETRAIADFTRRKKPLATVSYHCLGREIYYEFGQSEKDKIRDRLLCEYLNEKLNYRIVPDTGVSTGGYKDWCIQEFSIPSFTIELCPDEFGHPFTDYKKAEDDILRNIDLPMRLLSVVSGVVM